MWHILFSSRIAACEHRHDMPPNQPITNFRALLGALTLAFCWAHGRRKLKEIYDSDGSPIVTATNAPSISPLPPRP